MKEKENNNIDRIFVNFSKIKRFMLNKHSNDITHSEQMLLFKIDKWKKEKIIVTDIVNILELAPSTVSLTLNSLEDKGYIERTINKKNRREIYVSLTKKGTNMLENIKKRNHHLMNGLMNYLGKDDTQKLVELLEKTATFLESLEAENTSK